MNGYSPHLLLPSQWRELRNELAAATPVYIVLEHGGSVPREKVVSKSPAIVALLASRYRIAFASPETTMYELR
jgi:hypothetical protein